jgi:repressor LexA
VLAFSANTVHLNGIDMLTEKQEAILDFIRQYQRDEHVPPSTRIIQHRFGYKSQGTVYQHLTALAGKGQLQQFADGRWGVKVEGVQGHLFEVPIFGSIPAGPPLSQEQESDGHIAIHAAAFGIKNPRAGMFFALRVTGDSMIGDHIVDGDLVVCEWREPRIGEIIAALVDETTTTLKRVIRERGSILLRAANPRYADIKPRRLEAQGVVRGVIRKIA